MTREEAIALRPQSARAYGWQFGICLCSSLLTLAGLIRFWRPLLSKGMWTFTAVFLLVLLASTAQTWERLFRPIHAAERSASFSETSLKLSRRVGFVCSILGPVMYAVGSFYAMMTSFHHSFAGDMRFLGLLIWIINPILADLRGERLNQHFKTAVGPPIDWRSTARLSSEHWGER